ncbi:MAG TPA: FAD-dependent oxidoreductase, partial [Chloroflexota bacterium]
TVREESDPSYHLRRVSEALWPEFAAALMAESGLDPEYRETGCLYLAFDDRELEWLQHVAARAARGGASPGPGAPAGHLREAPSASVPSTRPGHLAQAAASTQLGEAASVMSTRHSQAAHGPSTQLGQAAAASSTPAGQAAAAAALAQVGQTAAGPSTQVGQAATESAARAGQVAAVGEASQLGPGGGGGDALPRLLDRPALREAEPALAPEVRGALLVAGGNVEPRRLCRALEIAARRAGVEVCSGVEVTSLQRNGDRVTGVRTTDGTLAAECVVLAAGAWSAGISGVEPRPRVRPQRGQIMAIDQSSIGLRHVLMTPEDPYFVPRCDGRLVIGATREESGWDPSLTVGGVAWLLERAMQVVPAARGCPIVELWTGFRPLSEDGLPFIGQGGLRGLYFLTGHGPSGISPLPGSLALLSALIAGEPPPLPPEPFDALRA